MPSPDQIPYVSQVRRLANIDDIGDIPVIGDIYGAANTVIDYAESDCHPDWNIYVETLFPALGEAVLVLLSFGLDDVLRGYFRPAGGRGFGGLGRASRRTRRLTRAQRARGLLRGGIPEIGELIGRHLPNAEVVRGRNIGRGERWLWRVDGIAQRGLWYWMVADVTEDFLVNWTTALLESEECNCPDAAGIRATGPAGIIPNDGDWHPFPIIFVEEEWGLVMRNSQSIFLEHNQTASITVDVAFEPFGLFDGVPQLRLRNVDTGATADATPNFQTAGNLGGVPMSTHGELRAGGQWQWEALAQGTPVFFSSATLNAWISGCAPNQS